MTMTTKRSHTGLEGGLRKRPRVNSQQAKNETLSQEQAFERLSVFRLFDLPPELRNKIFEFALATDNGKRRVLVPISDIDVAEIHDKERKAVETRKTHNSKYKHTPFPSIRVLEMEWLYTNRQIFNEATSILIKTNTIKVTHELDGLSVVGRKRIENVLELALDVQIEVKTVEADVWWLQLLQAKTNLRNVTVVIEAYNAFGDKWIRSEDEAKNDLGVFLALNPSKKGHVYYGGRGWYPDRYWSDIGNWIQAFMHEEIVPFLCPGQGGWSEDDSEEEFDEGSVLLEGEKEW